MLLRYSDGTRIWINPKEAPDVVRIYNEAKKKSGDYYGQEFQKLEATDLTLAADIVMVPWFAQQPIRTFIPEHYFDKPIPRGFLKTDKGVWALFDLLCGLRLSEEARLVGHIVSYVL